MRFAICTIAYNESEYIQACINNWKGLVDEHLVLVSTKPWNGKPVKDDGTMEIAKNAGAKVIVDYWASEAKQRNYGLDILKDYDYVLIVDPDEFYTKSDQHKLFVALNKPITNNYRGDRYIPAFSVKNVITYWKAPDYVLNPPDTHKPFIAVDPKQTRFFEHRQLEPIGYAELLDITCHHFSWVKSDKKIREKIQSYSHSSAIRPDWYEEVWEKWVPGCGMNVRPYGKPSVATYKECPEEVLNMLEK